MTARFDGTVIIGSGIAALSAALALAPEPVLILTAGRFGGDASSQWAQGGMAASLGPDDDAVLHAGDTIAAGAGLTDPAVANAVARAAADTVSFLESHGLAFDRDASGAFQLGLEAAHSRHRILHAGGDASGARIMRALTLAVRRTPSVEVREHCPVMDIETSEGRACAAIFLAESQPVRIAAQAFVLATGGIGGLFDATTNPSGNFGHGIALAARAGAKLADMEFVQFHPTALNVPAHPLPLVSEAVRGEGAVLINTQGARFMQHVLGQELAPRDIVARAIAREIARGQRTFLDARGTLGSRFASRFPAIDTICKAHGIDPTRQPIPVRPAAHYHMGGIATDLAGRTSVERLYAIGEVASTGLHGANRLASNSLLEAVVMGRAAAGAIRCETRQMLGAARENPRMEPERPDIAPARAIASAALGLLRDGESLRAAISGLLPLALGKSAARDPALVALLVAIFALLREESRGAHARLDFAGTDTKPARRFLTLQEALEHADAAAAPAPRTPRLVHA